MNTLLTNDALTLTITWDDVWHTFMTGLLTLVVVLLAYLADARSDIKYSQRGLKKTKSDLDGTNSELNKKINELRNLCIISTQAKIGLERGPEGYHGEESKEDGGRETSS